MIVRPRPHWLRILFVWRGSVLNKILPQLALTVALSVLVVWFQQPLRELHLTLTAAPFSLLGITVAIFLSFRNNASYERFVEGRRLWGRVLVEIRNLARLAVCLELPAPREPVCTALAFMHALRHALRGSPARADLERLLVEQPLCAAAVAAPVPTRLLLRELGRQLFEQGRRCGLNANLQVELDRCVAGLNDALGGCERITGTPLPFTYAVILHRTVYLYCFLLPFGLLDSTGWLTPLMVAVVAYTFFAIEAMADEIENPFAATTNGLPLAAICRDIEIAALDLLGQAELPPRLEPRDYLLT